MTLAAADRGKVCSLEIPVDGRCVPITDELIFGPLGTDCVQAHIPLGSSAGYAVRRRHTTRFMHEGRLQRQWITELGIAHGMNVVALFGQIAERQTRGRTNNQCGNPPREVQVVSFLPKPWNHTECVRPVEARKPHQDICIHHDPFFASAATPLFPARVVATNEVLAPRNRPTVVNLVLRRRLRNLRRGFLGASIPSPGGRRMPSKVRSRPSV